ncbi:unnamed protein product [Symbiodinium natans]|uniref:Uncharacterized protein n=1 Tax=Symbiodinium natans TaxID=878477 RepID=A0A812NN43_9DINO|nr:unnamed protein product [Symbiodinium natans]
MALQHSPQISPHEPGDVDSELTPTLPESAQEATHQYQSAVFRRAAYALFLLGAALVVMATATVFPMQAGEMEKSSSDASMEGMASELRMLAEVSCAGVTCDAYSTHDPTGTCEGPETSDDCLEKCCLEIECDDIPAFSCVAALGPSFFKRKITFFKMGKSGKCKGEENCKDTCCQGECATTTCNGANPCQRPFPPERCTPSKCPEQCCYNGDEYCGNGGANAYTSACKSCMSLTTYCENMMSLDFATTPRHEWNQKAFEMVMQGLLEPGCEVKEVPQCEDLLKFRVKATFPWHKASGEYVSANAVDIIAGGTQAVSGGDDMLIFIWRIEDGHFLRNYSAHYSGIRAISTFRDATFFCAASSTEVIVWRSSGPEDAGTLSVEFNTYNTTEVQTTFCMSVPTWETVIVGQTDSLTVIWHWKFKGTLTVPVDPDAEWAWQIDRDAIFVCWPDSLKGHPGALQKGFTEWRKNLFGIHPHQGFLGGSRRLLDGSDTSRGGDMSPAIVTSLEGKVSEEVQAQARRLRPADRTAPFTNWFTNERWGDVPVYFYEPDGWGKVMCIAAIPFDILYAVGYEDGSIRVWKTYNGFLKSLIPKAHEGSVNALVSAPAGNTLYSGGQDGVIRMWDVFSGKPQGELYAAHAGAVRSLEVIPGGNNIYSGHAFGLLLLWIPGEKKLWCELDTKAGSVNSLRVNPAVVGQVLAALENGDVRVYQMG